MKRVKLFIVESGIVGSLNKILFYKTKPNTNLLTLKAKINIFEDTIFMPRLLKKNS